jgi:hypothetical protein
MAMLNNQRVKATSPRRRIEMGIIQAKLTFLIMFGFDQTYQPQLLGES